MGELALGDGRYTMRDVRTYPTKSFFHSYGIVSAAGENHCTSYHRATTTDATQVDMTHRVAHGDESRSN